jgi:vacuolar-type H+-ATPase subunit C/Vma6
VIPEQLSRNFVELMDWITQAGNFELNRRVLRLNYQNIKVVIKGKVLDQRSYNLEIDLK